jgi:hypothetical protein
MKLSEAARKAIEMREAISAYWDEELPKRYRDYPLVHPGEDSGPPPPEQKKLLQFLKRLPEDVLYQLALIMYVGRGSFGTDQLAEHYKELREGGGAPALAALMAESGSLDWNLSWGLERLKSSGIDVDETLPKLSKP